jgi:hypothetical protein
MNGPTIPMRAAALAAALVFALPLAACGQLIPSGPAQTETRDVAGVDSVELHTSGDLAITVGETESLTITASGADLSSLTSDVRDGTLVLDMTGFAVGITRISYALTVRSLDRVQLSGSGSVTGAGVLGATSIVDLEGSGSANFTGLDTDELTVMIDGSGSVTVEGASDALELTMDGSGDFDGDGLRTRTTTASVAGSGSARVYASESVRAVVSGSGGLTYSGAPARVDADVSGSGEVVAD